MNYASNFDLQWNTFKQTQLDSYTGLDRNAKNLWSSTRWSKDDLNGKHVLEVGCGPGKYTEILLESKARVTAFDLTTAVFVNRDQNSGKGVLYCFQGDIYNLPDIGFFDYVFCYGVLQHCPDPDLAYKKIFELLKPGGRISIDYYTNPKTPTPWTTPKYFWRRWSTKIPSILLLRIIKIYLPLWLPIDTVIRLVPKIGPILLGTIRIPCWNYLDILRNALRIKMVHHAIYEWYQWAVMDTFDALGAKYDEPKTIEEVRRMVSLEGAEEIEVFYGSNGIVANVVNRV
jgi:SAM-dependent methyltransferase